MSARWLFATVLLVALASSLVGCARIDPVTDVVATPLTVVRDVVDVPHVALANAFEQGARKTKPEAYLTGPRDWEWRNNPGTQIPRDIVYGVCRGLSLGIGAIDYVVCRSIYPNFPRGVSPWVPEEQLWTKEMFFPNARALWAD
jgi:hypothetical protein